MNHHNFFFFLSLFLTTLLSQPTCTIDSSSFGTAPLAPPKLSPYTLSPSNEIIQGISYGQLISIGSRIWLLKPYTLPAAYTQFPNPCPNGWEIPSDLDLKNLVAAVTDPLAVLKNTSIFNMNSTLYYMSKVKSYTNYTSPSLSQTWAFNGIKFLSTGLPQITAINSYFSTSQLRTFCVLMNNTEKTSPGTSILNLKGIDQKDLYKGLKYVLSINNTNIIDYSWTLANVQSNSKYLDVIPMKEGWFPLYYKAKLFDGTIVADCKIVWVRNYTGSEGYSSFSLSNVNIVTYPFFQYRSFSLHFTSGSAPVAPKEDGGAYILYAEKSNMMLHVKTIDNNGKELSDFNLTVSGFPFDIISVGWGYVCLIKDYVNGNYLYLLGVDYKTNKTVFQRTLINASPTVPPTNYTSDQLIFFKDSLGTPYFGMNAMFNPSNGKLALGKQRLAVIFAHYNYFGLNADGTRSDHTGDTLITVNLTGKDEKLAFSWGCSHSLTQNLIYNGDKFMSQSLGDAYPQNIYFTIDEGLSSNGVVDPITGRQSFLSSKSSSTLLPDVMPGNGMGYSNGRLGNLIQLADGKTYVVPYARRYSWTMFDTANSSSTINELGLSFYDQTLTLLRDVSLGPGQMINQIQSCRYGQNIFLTYVVSNNHLVMNNQFLDPNIHTDDVQYMMLVDSSGNVLQSPLKWSTNYTILSSSDEIKMMSDGRCAWTYVDSSYLLNYAYLTPPPQTPTSYIDVFNSQFYNNGTFYLINSYDLMQYKSASVDPKNQTYLNFMDLGLSKLSLIASLPGMENKIKLN